MAEATQSASRNYLPKLSSSKQTDDTSNHTGAGQTYINMLKLHWNSSTMKMKRLQRTSSTYHSRTDKIHYIKLSKDAKLNKNLNICDIKQIEPNNYIKKRRKD